MMMTWVGHVACVVEMTEVEKKRGGRKLGQEKRDEKG